jgi:predicted O-linked N-acetylglucosamine transferase (SPINDLY family)
MSGSPRPHADLVADAYALHAAGRLDDAAALYAQALAHAPGDARVQAQLGLLRLQQQRPADAYPLLARAIALQPMLAEAQAGLGEALRQLGRAGDALAPLRTATQLRPTLASAWFNLALAQDESGDAAGAQASLLRVIDLRPADRRALRELGRLAEAADDLDAALRWLARRASAAQHEPDAVADLAHCHARRGELAQARALLQAALAQHPDHVRLHRIGGRVETMARDLEAALGHHATAAALDAADSESPFQAGLACDRMARLQEALEWFAEAARRAPARADVRNASGTAWLNLGHVGRAIDEYAAALALDPSFADAHSNALMALQYRHPRDFAAVRDAHVAWAAQHAPAATMARGAFANDRTAGRRLRVGYVSPRFCAGPGERLLLPLLRAHDSRVVELFLYATSSVRDAATARMRATAAAWRDCASLSDAALATRIRDDAIDVLVDLAGHCPGQRLRTFALRAAPVQVTWFDYVDTTGIAAMDWLVTDPLHTPPGSPQRFVERLLFVPTVRFPYAPAAVSPAAAPPCIANGHPTFGCFNRLSKFGPAVVALWSRVLQRMPAARLVLKSTAFDGASTRRDVEGRFREHGIDPKRLDLRGFSPEDAMLREYADIDVALDPFPYGGATTTCDALAMGVPVVALAGTSLAGRHAEAFLTAAGCAQWVAQSGDDYVARACALAGDAQRLALLRRELPQRFAASPVCDAPRFARELEDAWRRAWVDWCECPDGPPIGAAGAGAAARR